MQLTDLCLVSEGEDSEAISNGWIPVWALRRKKAVLRVSCCSDDCVIGLTAEGSFSLCVPDCRQNGDLVATGHLQSLGHTEIVNSCVISAGSFTDNHGLVCLSLWHFCDVVPRIFVPGSFFSPPTRMHQRVLWQSAASAVKATHSD